MRSMSASSAGVMGCTAVPGLRIERPFGAQVGKTGMHLGAHRARDGPGGGVHGQPRPVSSATYSQIASESQMATRRASSTGYPPRGAVAADLIFILRRYRAVG